MDLRKQFTLQRLGQAMSALEPRQRKILEMRNGIIFTGERQTLEDVGREFSVTRERIRQIEAKAEDIILGVLEII